MNIEKQLERAKKMIALGKKTKNAALIKRGLIAQMLLQKKQEAEAKDPAAAKE